MAYGICNKCKTLLNLNHLTLRDDDLYDCPVYGCNGEATVMGIDDLMLHTIKLLNENGICTKNCCSGHPYGDSTSIYVMSEEIPYDKFTGLFIALNTVFGKRGDIDCEIYAKTNNSPLNTLIGYIGEISIDSVIKYESNVTFIIRKDLLFNDSIYSESYFSKSQKILLENKKIYEAVMDFVYEASKDFNNWLWHDSSIFKCNNLLKIYLNEKYGKAREANGMNNENDGESNKEDTLNE